MKKILVASKTVTGNFEKVCTGQILSCGDVSLPLEDGLFRSQIEDAARYCLTEGELVHSVDLESGLRVSLY